MPFPHRVNGDGTIDSICDHCFATVGTSSSEEDLARSEASHLCEPARVAYYEQLDPTERRPPASDHSDLALNDVSDIQTRRLR